MNQTHVLSLSAATWADEVEKASVPVLVDFGANWCPPCRMLAPIVADLAVAYSGVLKVGAVDTDSEVDLAAQFGVQGLPTILIFKGGQVVERITGFTPKKELKQRLEAILR